MSKLQKAGSGTSRAADILKALAHPLRLRTIEILDTATELGVTELASLLEAEQSLVSHHLGKMHGKGILRLRRQGKNNYYSLTDRKITGLISCINNCRKII